MKLVGKFETCFILLLMILYVLANTFQSCRDFSWDEPVLLNIVKADDKVSCSLKQHSTSATDEARTIVHKSSTLALSHCSSLVISKIHFSCVLF